MKCIPTRGTSNAQKNETLQIQETFQKNRQQHAQEERRQDRSQRRYSSLTHISVVLAALPIQGCTLSESVCLAPDPSQPSNTIALKQVRSLSVSLEKTSSLTSNSSATTAQAAEWQRPVNGPYDAGTNPKCTTKTPSSR